MYRHLNSLESGVLQVLMGVFWGSAEQQFDIQLPSTRSLVLKWARTAERRMCFFVDGDYFGPMK